jgi:hypothetical protein
LGEREDQPLIEVSDDGVVTVVATSYKVEKVSTLKKVKGGAKRVKSLATGGKVKKVVAGEPVPERVVDKKNVKSGKVDKSIGKVDKSRGKLLRGDRKRRIEATPIEGLFVKRVPCESAVWEPIVDRVFHKKSGERIFFQLSDEWVSFREDSGLEISKRLRDEIIQKLDEMDRVGTVQGFVNDDDLYVNPLYEGFRKVAVVYSDLIVYTKAVRGVSGSTKRKMFK